LKVLSACSSAEFMCLSDYVTTPVTIVTSLLRCHSRCGLSCSDLSIVCEFTIFAFNVVLIFDSCFCKSAAESHFSIFPFFTGTDASSFMMNVSVLTKLKGACCSWLHRLELLRQAQAKDGSPGHQLTGKQPAGIEFPRRVHSTTTRLHNDYI